MSKPTEIEKESLEAHVELCAVRYNNLEQKLDNLEQRIDKLELHLIGIKDSIDAKLFTSGDKTVGYLITILGVLLSAILGYIGHGLFK